MYVWWLVQLSESSFVVDRRYPFTNYENGVTGYRTSVSASADLIQIMNDEIVDEVVAS